MENNQETITQYIDMDIVEFIEKVTATKSFTEIHSMEKLMDMEHCRLTQHREILATRFAKVEANSEEFKSIFLRYVGTFVLEQKLIDRRAVLGHISKFKGISNAMRPKATKSSQKQANTESERTCKSKVNVAPKEITK